MSRRLYITFVIVALAGTLTWRFWPRAGAPGPAVFRQPARPPAAGGVAADPGHANPNPAPEDIPIEDAPSQLADDLNSPKSDIHADLRLLNDLFMHYRSAVRDDNPVGDNADITAVLTGRNRLGFAFIPKDHPAINANGELCDRWGTPYFFHQLSGEEMEIRSAGPDRKLWTADDEVLTP